MKNVAFILRGCPGLGRFVGTFEISKILNDSGQYNLFYVTYLEGSSYLKKKGVEHLEISNRYDLTPLGIQPISLSAEKIFDFIQENKIEGFFDLVCGETYKHMRKHSEEKVPIDVILFDFDGNILARKSEQ